jgi:hypothetical protein
MNKFIYGFAAALICAGVLVAALTSEPVQVIADKGGVMFSHAAHKELADCATCHNAGESSLATDNLLPSASVCASCHEAADVRTYWSLAEDANLETTVLPVRDRKLHFSHAAHTKGTSLNCESCHGAILADDASGMPSMETCYTCHNNAEKIVPINTPHVKGVASVPAGNQCEACHVTLAGLIPANHRVSNFQQFHGKLAAEGEADRDCAVCHSTSFCQSCHTPTNGVPAGVKADAFYQAAHPRGEKIDDGKLLTLQGAHSLTYRYTHGFDARAQSSRCATCHETESFCATCHQNGYDASGVRIVPQSHQLAGFVSLTGGKLMNRHGKLAQMDMESCATCHQVDGGDPICAPCHSTGLVKGGTR